MNLVPLKYNLRSLRVRWVSAALTTLGIAMVTAVFVSILALSEGMRRMLVETGDPKNFVVMRDGPISETQSAVERADADAVKTLPGIAIDADGRPLVSAEMVIVIMRKKADGGETNVLMRGANAVARRVRDGLALEAGRWPEDGRWEAVVGAALARRFPDLNVGSKVKYKHFEWSVVGILDSQGRAYDSEVWVGVDELVAATDRPFSSVIVRTSDVERFKSAMEADPRFKSKLKAHDERQYFRDQMASAEMLKGTAWFVAILLGLGACFGAANTMYASVASRSREIATLRVLGFSSIGIWLGFILESALVALPGGILGGLLGKGATALAGTTGTLNFITFTEMAFNFRVTPGVAVSGAVMAIMLGVVGGFFPALRAARTPIVNALRSL